MKLKFPWLSDDYVSDWARTVQPGAGKDRGWIVLPEVGDEVLVGFEQGDFDRPFVLGGLYNGVDTMPAGPNDLIDSGSGAINRRSLVSRRGHRIDLLDQDGQQGGHHAGHHGRQAPDLHRHDRTPRSPCTRRHGADRGTKGITIDATNSDLT